MKSLLRQAALAAAVLVTASSAVAGVNVTFAGAENFADLPRDPWDRERAMREITEHFVKLSKRLPQGQDLNVEILDIDLAGRERPVRGAHWLRVLEGGADWPHMKLRYTITQDGQVVKSGEDNLSNMLYTDRLNRYFSGDALRYEKQMLDEWFMKKVAVR